MLAGVPEIVGGVSATVTVNDVWALFPCASVAVQVTAVVPIANVVPDAGEHVTGTVPSTVSVAVGLVYATPAPEGPLWTVMLAGVPVMVGGVVSWTMTAKVDCAVFPKLSVAVQMTVVMAIGNVEPGVGRQVTGTEVPFESVAVGLV